MMKIWLEPQTVDAPAALRDVVGGHPLIAETLTRRGFINANTARAFLNPADYTPASPWDLPDMEVAVERLQRALKNNEPICVWGDFDVDGQTSTSLLVSALGDLGANVSYHIPLRQAEGHGITVPVLTKEIDGGATLILTCDTGITAHEAVDYANSRDVDVIVTDHHQLPPKLPNAYANINPQRVESTHPLHTLPGVGCAYKLIEALYEVCDGGDTSHFLDLVALGIVADVATQTGDARYLLQRGLEVLRTTERLGLKALMDVAELNQARLTEEHIGFMLGPRMNALGRLDDANRAVELLTTDNLETARVLANALEGLNAQRKLYSQQVFDGAQSQIEQQPELVTDYNLIVLANPHWHTGVVGIVASRLVEQYNKPVILLRTPAGEPARGSARSVEGCDITAAIASQKHLLLGFGGHTMAAGLSLDPLRIDEFRAAASHHVKEQLGDDVDRPARLQISGYVDLDELTLDLVAEIERLAPFGAGNPPLVLAARDVEAKNLRKVGRSGDHLQLTVANRAGTDQRVIWWNGAEMPQPFGRFDLAFVARESDFRGERRVEVEWVDFRLIESLEKVIAPTIEVIDYRGELNPLSVLESLRRSNGNLQVWGEVNGVADGVARFDLRDADALAIWTTPPGAAELRAVIGQVSPQTVYLFGIDPEMDSFKTFVDRLAGLVKYALRKKDGRVTVSQLATLTAQRERTARAGLSWLVAQGAIKLSEFDGENVLMGPGNDQPDEDEFDAATGTLRGLLSETAAYRRQFHRTTNPLE